MARNSGGGTGRGTRPRGYAALGNLGGQIEGGNKVSPKVVGYRAIGGLGALGGSARGAVTKTPAKPRLKAPRPSGRVTQDMTRPFLTGDPKILPNLMKTAPFLYRAAFNLGSKLASMTDPFDNVVGVATNKPPKRGRKMTKPKPRA